MTFSVRKDIELFQKMAKFYFGKSFESDLALLSETQSINPYSVFKTKSKNAWEAVAKNFKDSKLKLDVNHRQCRERVTLLIKEFKGQEALSVKSSGIEEAEMNKVKDLLTSISSLIENGPLRTAKSRTTKKRFEAEKTRQEALLVVQNLEDGQDEFSVLDDMIANDDDLINRSERMDEPAGARTTQDSMDYEGVRPKKCPKRGQQTTGLIDYLKTKNQEEIGVKREELKVRAAEAENRKFELQLSKERQDVELEDKRKFTDLLLELVKKKS